MAEKAPPMSNDTNRVLVETIIRILRPLIRIALRNGMTYKAFAEAAKSVFVDIAAEDFRIPGRKQSDSRISVITGLSRKEVKRVKLKDEYSEDMDPVLYNRASRVITGWTQDPDFTDEHGAPRDLNLEGPEPSFPELVRRYSGDAPPRAILDEMERVGSVERNGVNKLTLLTRAYITQSNDVEKLRYLGEVVSQLLRTMDRNFWDEDSEPLFQRIVANDQMPAESAEAFRVVTKQKGQELLETLDRWLSENEVRDTDRVDEADLRRVGLGMYYFEDEFED